MTIRCSSSNSHAFVFMSRVKSIIIVSVLISLCSCNNQFKGREELSHIIQSWIGKTIILPDTLTVELQNHPIDIDISNADFSVLTVLNTEKGCSSCQMKLAEWERLMTNLESRIGENSLIQLLYVIEAFPNKEIRDIIKYYDFKYPVIYDPYKLFEGLNQFPSKDVMKTFLLDDNFTVKVIGDPTFLKPLQNLYNEVLNHCESSVISPSCSTIPYKLSSRRIALGAVTPGRRKVATVTVKNITDSIIQVNKIVSSCPCISSIMKRKILTPGSEAELKIVFNPDTLINPLENKEIIRNLYVYFNEIEEPAEIEMYGYYFSNISDD